MTTGNLWEEVKGDDAAGGAAAGLLALMSGISQDLYCATWMAGLEFHLWEAPPGMRYGQGELTERQSALLRLLSEECGGWWHWPEDKDGPHTVSPQFIARDAWLVLRGKAEIRSRTEEKEIG